MLRNCTCCASLAKWKKPKTWIVCAAQLRHTSKRIHDKINDACTRKKTRSKTRSHNTQKVETWWDCAARNFRMTITSQQTMPSLSARYEPSTLMVFDEEITKKHCLKS